MMVNRLRAWGLAIGVALAATVAPAEVPLQNSAPLYIANDRGGDLRARIYEIRHLQETGQRIKITGRICYSTCTMYLGLPQTCVSPGTTFGFHGPSSNGKPLEPAVFDRASELIVDHYPDPLKRWYIETARHTIHGLHRISGTEMIRMGVPEC